MAAKKAATPEFADHVTKAQEGLTQSTELFVDWLVENTGYDVDPVTVQLTRSLVHRFQKSEANQKRLSSSKEKAASAPAKKAPAKKSAAKKSAPAKKTAAKSEGGSVSTPSKRRRRQPQAAESASEE